MKPVFIIDLANLEQLDAVDFYKLESEELEIAFKTEIHNILSIICRFPGIGDNISNGIKKCQLVDSLIKFFIKSILII